MSDEQTPSPSPDSNAVPQAGESGERVLNVVFWTGALVMAYLVYLQRLVHNGENLTAMVALRGPLIVAILVLSVCVHESAHAAAAYWAGDPTARDAGRVTLNPLAHISLWGSILFPILLMLMKASFIFGWAKPVRMDLTRMRHPRRDMALSAVAGPISNFLLAFLAATGLSALVLISPDAALRGLALVSGHAQSWNGSVEFIAWLLTFLGILNISLGVFNLLPIPPLDGSWVVRSLIPPSKQRFWNKTALWIVTLVFLYLAFTVFKALLGFLLGGQR